jgi:hypothetical protein
VAPAEARASMTRLAILIVGIAIAAVLLRRSAGLTGSTPERFDAGLRQPAGGASAIPGVRTIDHTLRMAVASAGGLEFMLKPILRELVAWRLMRNRRIDLDAAPVAARNATGEQLWRLIEAADERPDWRARGVTLVEVEAGLDELERI